MWELLYNKMECVKDQVHMESIWEYLNYEEHFQDLLEGVKTRSVILLCK